MNSTFIIVLFLLVLPRNALFCKGFRASCGLLWNYRLWQIRAELSKLLLPVSSKNGSKREILTTKAFLVSHCNIISKYITQLLWSTILDSKQPNYIINIILLFPSKRIWHICKRQKAFIIYHSKRCKIIFIIYNFL